jgi:hypothetical protein
MLAPDLTLNLKLHYRVHKSRPTNQYTLLSNPTSLRTVLILSSNPRQSPSSGPFSYQNCVRTSHLPNASYMPQPSHGLRKLLVTTAWRPQVANGETASRYGQQQQIYWISSHEQRNQLSIVKFSMLRNVMKCFGLGQVLWHIIFSIKIRPRFKPNTLYMSVIFPLALQVLYTDHCSNTQP